MYGLLETMAGDAAAEGLDGDVGELKRQMRMITTMTTTAATATPTMINVRLLSSDKNQQTV